MTGVIPEPAADHILKLDFDQIVALFLGKLQDTSGVEQALAFSSISWLKSS